MACGPASGANVGYYVLIGKTHMKTLGLRNERWRSRLDVLALAYAWIIALGFISIPLAVLTGCLK